MFDKNQLANLMKKAQEMQTNLQKAQEEVAKLEVVGESGAGLVKITMTGKHEVKAVNIDKSLLSGDDVEMLEDLIAAAINDATHKIEDVSSSKMGGIADIPGMPAGFKLPF
jgi:DNA-binding YbaB/EbfC family protein